MASSPRIVKGPIDKHPPDTEAMQKPRLAVHHRSACSGLKALRNTSAARRQTAKLCYRFGPLTPSARSANLIAGDGTKNGFHAPNKEPATNQKQLLDTKSPIQVRIWLPPAESCANLRQRRRIPMPTAQFARYARPYRGPALKFSACMAARKAIRNPKTQQEKISTIASVGPKHPSPKRPRPSATCARITHSSI